MLREATLNVFSKRTKSNPCLAEALVKFSQEDRMKEFDKTMGKLGKAENIKAATRERQRKLPNNRITQYSKIKCPSASSD